VDPGAVPGGSTQKHLGVFLGGAETGSTRAIKIKSASVARLFVIGAKLTNANDNFAFVAANDNSFVGAEKVAA
jgi:hypothetical protein